MALIHVSNLTFQHEGAPLPLFCNLSFQIDSDWRLGLIGRNGRGKSTLLKLLQGEYAYDGRITSPLSFSYFPFYVNDNQLSGQQMAEQLAAGCDLWQLQRELSLLDVDEEILLRPYATLSGGERVKLQLAMLFIRENRFLLIDEPTNHLDRLGREIVSRYLRKKSQFILVSHDRNFLDSSVDHILSLNKEGIDVQKGNYSSWKANRDRQDAFEIAENRQFRKEIKQLKTAAMEAARQSDAVERSKKGVSKIDSKSAMLDRGYVGHKAAKMMKRSKNLEVRQQKAIQEKSMLLKDFEPEEQLSIHPISFTQQRLFEAHGLCLYRNGRKICGPLDFYIERGDRVLLSGVNGAGKSTLIQWMLGEPIAHSGEFWRGSALRCSYVSQQTEWMKGGLKKFVLTSGIDESLFKALLRKFGIGREHFEMDLSCLSMGQKKKILLAKSLCQQAHLYLWDEPLNYVDIVSRIQIESLLVKHEPTLFFIEHDTAFCDAVATKRIQL